MDSSLFFITSNHPNMTFEEGSQYYKMSLRKFSLTSSIVGLSLDFGRVMNCTEILPLYIQHRNNLIGLMGGVMTSDRILFL